MPFFKYTTYHLYLLQLENYKLSRYWRLVRKKGLFPPREPLRKKLVWTTKTKFIALGALICHAIAGAGAPIFISIFLPETDPYTPSNDTPFLIVLFISFLIGFFLYPIFYSIILTLAHPFEHLIKQTIISRARRRIASLPHLTIIGIAGSYGKTTMKEVIATLLAQKFTVVKTPESVNTPVGIARLIVKKVTAQTRVFIVEMGEHYHGDIAYLCRITPPAISVVTGINEAHLERLKTIENVVATIFEIAEGTVRDGIIVLNADDELIQNHYKKYTHGRETFFYSASPSPVSPYHGRDVVIDESGTGMTFTLFDGERSLSTFTVPFLGQYVIGDIAAAWMIGRRLGMNNGELARGIASLQPIPHRLQLIQGERGILIIDDSYNGNPNGVREAIAALATFTGRRKVYITPGLVEMGKKTREVHREIGKELSKVADLVILIKTSVAPHIAEGLFENGFPKHAIHWYDSAREAHKALPALLHKNDVVLFQNDWGDNYM